MKPRLEDIVLRVAGDLFVLFFFAIPPTIGAGWWFTLLVFKECVLASRNVFCRRATHPVFPCESDDRILA